jgi:hypothetical protein
VFEPAGSVVVVPPYAASISRDGPAGKSADQAPLADVVALATGANCPRPLSGAASTVIGWPASGVPPARSRIPLTVALLPRSDRSAPRAMRWTCCVGRWACPAPGPWNRVDLSQHLNRTPAVPQPPEPSCSDTHPYPFGGLGAIQVLDRSARPEVTVPGISSARSRTPTRACTCSLRPSRPRQRPRVAPCQPCSVAAGRRFAAHGRGSPSRSADHQPRGLVSWPASRPPTSRLPTAIVHPSTIATRNSRRSASDSRCVSAQTP